jgi:5-methylcytosine-specific restriction endonuclease McrA
MSNGHHSTEEWKKHVHRIEETKWRKTEGKKWEKIRKWMLKKYDHTCQECGKHGNFVHHIKPVAEFPHLQFNKGNLVLLCLRCHRNRHPELPDELFTYD